MNNQKIQQYQAMKSHWIDQLIEKKLNPVSLWVLNLLGNKMADNKMNAFYRLLHVIFGLFNKLEIKEHQSNKFIENNTKTMVDSIRVEVFLNKKLIGEKTFKLSLILKK